MNDCILNFTIDEYLQIKKESFLPFRLIERNVLKSAFEQFLYIFDSINSAKYFHPDTFQKGIDNNTIISNYKDKIYLSIDKDLFFYINLYSEKVPCLDREFNLKFNTNQLFESLKKIQSLTIIEKLDFEPEDLSNAALFNKVKFAYLCEKFNASKIILINYNELRKEIDQNSFQLDILSFKLCLKLKIKDIFTFINSANFINAIPNNQLINIDLLR